MAQTGYPPVRNQKDLDAIECWSHPQKHSPIKHSPPWADRITLIYCHSINTWRFMIAALYVLFYNIARCAEVGVITRKQKHAISIDDEMSSTEITVVLSPILWFAGHVDLHFNVPSLLSRRLFTYVFATIYKSDTSSFRCGDIFKMRDRSKNTFRYWFSRQRKNLIGRHLQKIQREILF